MSLLSSTLAVIGKDICSQHKAQFYDVWFVLSPLFILKKHAEMSDPFEVYLMSWESVSPHPPFLVVALFLM